MRTKKKNTEHNVIDQLVELQIGLEKLPALSELDRAKFDQAFAIDQLYYSNKLEGTLLTSEDINAAIHDKERLQTT